MMPSYNDSLLHPFEVLIVNSLGRVAILSSLSISIPVGNSQLVTQHVILVYLFCYFHCLGASK